jgi:hypothetical protein
MDTTVFALLYIGTTGFTPIKELLSLIVLRVLQNAQEML